MPAHAPKTSKRAAAADTLQPAMAKPRLVEHHQSSQAAAEPGIGFDFSGLRSRAPAIPSPLAITQAGNSFEQEADRIADRVMRVPAEQPGGRDAAALMAAAPRVQRTAARADGGGAAPSIVHDVLSTAGRPLDAATRAFMEPRFGADFSQVRVHADAGAARSARAIGARAYTVGSHIGFRNDAYRPQTAAGQRLLAHELAHVVQQSGGGAVLQRQPDGDDTPDIDEEKAHKNAMRETRRAVFGGGQGLLRPLDKNSPLLAHRANLFPGKFDASAMKDPLNPPVNMNSPSSKTDPDSGRAIHLNLPPIFKPPLIDQSKSTVGVSGSLEDLNADQELVKERNKVKAETLTNPHAEQLPDYDPDDHPVDVSLSSWKQAVDEDFGDQIKPNERQPTERIMGADVQYNPENLGFGFKAGSEYNATTGKVDSVTAGIDGSLSGAIQSASKLFKKLGLKTKTRKKKRKKKPQDNTVTAPKF